jgi:hypothetical protein
MKVWQYFLSVCTNGYLWIFSYRELYGVANVVTAGLSVRALSLLPTSKSKKQN